MTPAVSSAPATTDHLLEQIEAAWVSEEFAANQVWHVPRNSRPNPFLARGRSLVLVASVGVGLLVIVLGSAASTAVFWAASSPPSPSR